MPDPRRLGLSWRDLPAELRAALMDKLAGLYEQDSDESAFDSLAVDKQQALLILTHRLRELSLWAAVERVENVYGEGGVGMNFAARPTLLEMLRRHPRFMDLSRYRSRGNVIAQTDKTASGRKL